MLRFQLKWKIDLLTFFSLYDLLEPVDVRNWFSSYVYESPILDTADGFKDSLAKETECEDNESMVEESKRNKAKDYREFRRTKSSDDGEISNGLGNYDKTCEYYKHGKQSPDKVHILYPLLKSYTYVHSI